uniref:Uncharacterized protein n=1 Tax=Haptolina ericina TaxID=156174 RepID=A0A7S3B5T4_9EUKA|mmetsp:Transcript_51922/g.116569  ORF Transcript_51922/g.116569 Transcript_51922/m.116569 type:complete len:233 (+) Transcript_51922:300-998(+)
MARILRFEDLAKQPAQILSTILSWLRLPAVEIDVANVARDTNAKYEREYCTASLATPEDRREHCEMANVLQGPIDKLGLGYDLRHGGRLGFACIRSALDGKAFHSTSRYPSSLELPQASRPSFSEGVLLDPKRAGRTEEMGGRTTDGREDAGASRWHGRRGRHGPHGRRAGGRRADGFDDTLREESRLREGLGTAGPCGGFAPSQRWARHLMQLPSPQNTPPLLSPQPADWR